MSADVKKLSDSLSFRFKRVELLDLALSHRSYVHEQRWPLERSNERLEFLGDAVLGLCIAEALVKSFPEETEGALSKRRAALVNQNQLARLAESLELGAYLRLGRGEEKTGGRSKKSLLCDAFEALIGAMYLDQGLDSVRSYVLEVFAPLIPASKTIESSQDYKTRVQEHFQRELRKSPRYVVVAERGPDHLKTFEVRVEINGEVLAVGSGNSKREAEQNAAATAFDKLKLDEHTPRPKKKKKRRKNKRARSLNSKERKAQEKKADAKAE